ncbi:MAG: hypothetical protein SGBAC_008282 [Bacillariaceae sp.]
MGSIFDQFPAKKRCFSLCNPTGTSIGESGQVDISNFDVLMMQQNENTSNNNRRSLSAADQRKQKEIDELLSEAMNQLTFAERQRQTELLHGVEDKIIEEPVFLNNALQNMEDYLSLYKHGSAYEIAESLDPDYVTDTELRTLFLRCNHYDAKKSACHMLQFFVVKQNLFGEEKLVHEITIHDLDEDDIAALNWIRLIGKDSSNRVAYLQLPGLRNFKTLRNELRGKFYFQMWLLRQSEGTRLKGVVEINYAVGEFFNRSKAGYVENAELSNSTPLFHAAVHFACDDVKETLITTLALKIMPPDIRARFRIHCGSHIECQYRLSTFGISKVPLPTLDKDKIDFHMHGSQAFLEGGDNMTYPTSSSSSPSSSPSSLPYTKMITTQPNENDVLYTGGRTSNNMGNHQLRKLVTELSLAYDASTNEAKRSMIGDMMHRIQINGGRFLKYVDGVQPAWIVTPEDEVRTKIAQMFRNHKRATSRKKIIDGTPIQGGPLQDDVIFGKSQKKNRGKDLMHLLIKERFDEYDSVDRGMKANVVNVVLESIKSHGGRFLQPVEECNGIGIGIGSSFLEVSDDKARERISKYFRNYRRASKKVSHMHKQ